MTMFNRNDLAKDVASALGIQKAAAAEVIDYALGTILIAAARGDGYRLAGFGTFAPKTRAARVGRNPQTGAPVDIPARTALTFKPAKTASPKGGA